MASTQTPTPPRILRRQEDRARTVWSLLGHGLKPGILFLVVVFLLAALGMVGRALLGPELRVGERLVLLAAGALFGGGAYVMLADCITRTELSWDGHVLRVRHRPLPLRRALALPRSALGGFRLTPWSDEGDDGPFTEYTLYVEHPTGPTLIPSKTRLVGPLLDREVAERLELELRAVVLAPRGSRS